jgi:hypothetical protein
MFPAGTTVVPNSTPATAVVSTEVSTLVLLISLVLISVGLLAPTISG